MGKERKQYNKALLAKKALQKLNNITKRCSQGAAATKTILSIKRKYDDAELYDDDNDDDDYDVANLSVVANNNNLRGNGMRPPNNNNNNNTAKKSGNNMLAAAEATKSKAAYIPFCRLPLPYNVGRQKLNMNSYESFTYARALADEQRTLAIKMNGGKLKGRGSLKGRGLIPTDPNIHDILGSQAPTGNMDYSNTPTLQGKRSLGSAQPGAEKLNFEPSVKIQDTFDNIQEIIVPASNRNPGIVDLQVWTYLSQQAGAYMDTKTLEKDYYMQLWKGNSPGAPVTAGEKYLDCISLINNIGASLIKDWTITLNNQILNVNTTNYAINDYFETLWFSELDKEVSGSLIDQGFIFESPGSLSDCTMASGISSNAKTMYYAKKLMKGEKVRVTVKPKSCFTGSTTFVPMTNKIEFMTLFNRPEFYLQVSPQSKCPGSTPTEKKTNYDGALELCKQLRISVTDVQYRFKKYELSPSLTEDYIKSYTMDHPDTFMFTHHEFRTISISPSATTFQQSLNWDGIPDLIFLTLGDKRSITGSFTTSPFITFPIPEASKESGFELGIKINNQTWRPQPIKNNSEAYRRMKDILYDNYRNPLLNRAAIIGNDTRETGMYDTEMNTTGYAAYAFVMTMTGKGSDGTFYEDRRSGNMELICQLTNGATWPDNYEWRIHAFSRRNYSIDNIGQISKNFL